MIPGIRKPNKMICRAIAWPTALSKHRQEARQKPWILSVVVHFGWSISERASFHSSGTRFSNYPDLRFPFRRNDVVFTPEKSMMGEFIIYYRGKIVGGIYDDRFLVKPTKSAVAMMPNAEMELPYEGAKEMLLVDDVDNKRFLRELLDAMYDELPASKKKK